MKDAMIAILKVKTNMIGDGSHGDEIEVRLSERGYAQVKTGRTVKKWYNLGKLADMLAQEIAGSCGDAGVAFDGHPVYTDVTGKTVDFAGILEHMLPLPDAAL